MQKKDKETNVISYKTFSIKLLVTLKQHKKCIQCKNNLLLNLFNKLAFGPLLSLHKGQTVNLDVK